MTVSKTIGQILRDRRLCFRISQRTVAEELGVRRPQLSAWESGKKQPRFNTVCQWARVLAMHFELREGRS